MADFQDKLAALREEISQLPPEYQVLARYVEALHGEQREQIQEMRHAFETAKGAAGAIRWLAGLGAALAVMWGALHGMKP